MSRKAVVGVWDEFEKAQGPAKRKIDPATGQLEPVKLVRRAKCKHCKKVCPFRDGTKMYTHLKECNPSLCYLYESNGHYAIAPSNDDNHRATTTTITNLSSSLPRRNKQESIDDAFNRLSAKYGPKSQGMIDRLLGFWHVEHNIPLCAFKSVFFKTIMALLNPHVKTPGPKKMRDEILPSIKSDIRSLIEKVCLFELQMTTVAMLDIDLNGMQCPRTSDIAW